MDVWEKPVQLAIHDSLIAQTLGTRASSHSVLARLFRHLFEPIGYILHVVLSVFVADLEVVAVEQSRDIMTWCIFED